VSQLRGGAIGVCPIELRNATRTLTLPVARKTDKVASNWNEAKYATAYGQLTEACNSCDLGAR
jgi:hypothetical protein